MKSPLAEKYLSLGVALHRERRLGEAETFYRQALEAAPGDADIRVLLAEALREQRRFDESLEASQGIASAAAYNSQGMVLADQGRLGEAIPLLSSAVREAPSDPDPLVNLARLVAKMSRAEEAMGYYLSALKLDPTHAGALSGLGMLERDLRHYENAVECLRRALKQEPNRADLWNNLALAQDEMGSREEAAIAYRHCLDLDPTHAAAEGNLGMCLLAQGKLIPGFEAYEARWKRADMPPRPFKQPRWTGEELHGKTILLHAEQCLGDTLHFCRYAPLVKRRGAAKVILEVQLPLKALLGSLDGVDLLIAEGCQPLFDFDLHCPLLSLPTVFKTSLLSIPADIPYLKADKSPWLSEAPGPKIGLAWHGNAKFRGEDWRSPGIGLFAEVLKSRPDVKAVCLQAGGRAEFLAALGEQALDLGHEVDTDTPPFLETASLMAGLDLVISSDTSVPHLAGALGVPTWMALPEPAEWRWLEGRDDSPWYPGMRLFRQDGRDDWASVAAKLIQALQGWRPSCG